MKRAITILALASVITAAAPATPIPASFDSRGADRAAIQALLDTYTRAVSTKDRAAFEAILLGTDIPFSGVGAATRPGGGVAGTRNYDDFRRGVFAGPPFTQRFRDVQVQQDGALAQVSLVFVNTDAHGSSWGFKTLQLLKVDGAWKIASEFYTGHRG